MKTLLDTYWEASNVLPKPAIIIANDPDDPFSRVDYTVNDVLAIKSEGPEQVRYRGNIRYYDKSYPLSIEYRTIDSRQRIRNAWRMIRRIVFSHLWDFQPVGYQLIRMVSYQEAVGSDLKLWRIVVRISLESAAISRETL